MSDYKIITTPFLSGTKFENEKDTPLVDFKLYRHLMGIILYLTKSHSNLSYIIGAVYTYMEEPH